MERLSKITNDAGQCSRPSTQDWNQDLMNANQECNVQFLSFFFLSLFYFLSFLHFFFLLKMLGINHKGRMPTRNQNTVQVAFNGTEHNDQSRSSEEVDVISKQSFQSNTESFQRFVLL
jgi:hypothetical protein